MDSPQYCLITRIEKAGLICFKPYYKWIVLNTGPKGTGRKQILSVLNLIINGQSSILGYTSLMSLTLNFSVLNLIINGQSSIQCGYVGEIPYDDKVLNLIINGQSSILTRMTSEQEDFYKVLNLIINGQSSILWCFKI